jgi:prephenate dehydrogenase
VINTLGIVGVGLLGGSLALAVKQRQVARRVLGTDRLPGLLLRAAERGLLDETRPDVPSLAAGCDVVVFCTPVDVIAAQVIEAGPHCRPGTVLTDVGSTKAGIVRAVEGRLPAGVDYIGGHPLAGSEKTGPEHSRTDLFAARLVLLTPGPEAAMAAVRRLWEGLGAHVEVIDAEEHDQALALTSHLPHLVASALAGALPAEWARVTASGFRDTTRLAAGSPELWRAIFVANREAVREALSRFRDQLDAFDAALRVGDDREVERLLEEAKRVRDSLSK